MLDGHEPEFGRWRWARPDEVLDLIVAFKRPVYEALLAEFAPLLHAAPSSSRRAPGGGRRAHG